MSTSPVTIDLEKARGRSISFKPYSLYEHATSYGETCKPVRSPSSIVCEALKEYLENRGVDIGEVKPDEEFYAKIEAAVAVKPELKPSIEKLIHTALRQKSAA